MQQRHQLFPKPWSKLFRSKFVSKNNEKFLTKGLLHYTMINISLMKYSCWICETLSLRLDSDSFGVKKTLMNLRTIRCGINFDQSAVWVIHHLSAWHRRILRRIEPGEAGGELLPGVFWVLERCGTRICYNHDPAGRRR